MFSAAKKFSTSSTVLAFIIASVLLTTPLAGCQRKSGCPVNDDAKAQVNRKGEYSKKRGSSNLFPKHMRRN